MVAAHADANIAVGGGTSLNRKRSDLRGLTHQRRRCLAHSLVGEPSLNTNKII